MKIKSYQQKLDLLLLQKHNLKKEQIKLSDKFKHKANSIYLLDKRIEKLRKKYNLKQQQSTL